MSALLIIIIIIKELNVSCNRYPVTPNLRPAFDPPFQSIRFVI